MLLEPSSSYCGIDIIKYIASIQYNNNQRFGSDISLLDGFQRWRIVETSNAAKKRLHKQLQPEQCQLYQDTTS